MNSIQSQHVVLHKEDICQTYEQELIGEEPLLLLIEDRPYSVVMRTPGEEIPHVAGFCLGEGLVDDFEDFSTIGYCDQMDPNVVTVKLQPARRKKVATLLERRGFISQTSCGICGKEMVKDICQALTPITDETRFNIGLAIACVDQLVHNQDFYKRTGGSHAAMLFDSKLDVLSVAEDVGRHNALDKAIGKIFLSRQLTKARLAVLSSRISYELVQKAARANLPILVSISRPTALAVELGQSLNMTLACMGKESGLLVFCGEERLTRE
ncbi:MAG: formate dehydrogenase accessory sulfurtransferase FdhD [Deltaproteobacteria bacterium]|nr:formate dehydrogenase accessory sulfurtransferase FdhD [Deltaproteobacteria bacterium]